jgi:RNA polymerase sigma factor (TIGR02999 family)
VWLHVMRDAEDKQAPLTAESLSPDQLLALVYDELRKLAANKMRNEGPGQTLQATALVHEAWLRMGADKQPVWASRAHFFSAAAEAMRRILIDKARRRNALRRGALAEKVDVDELEIAGPREDDQLMALHEALDRFAQIDPAKAELVKLKFFVGLTLEEAAEILALSVPTAKRQWAYARAWLFREISRST